MKRRFRYNPQTDKVEEVTPPKRAASKFNRFFDKPVVADLALQVEPEHVEFQKQIDRENGLGDVEYTPAGAPVFRSRKAFNDYKRAYGYFDRNAGFGDVMPNQAPPKRR